MCLNTCLHDVFNIVSLQAQEKTIQVDIQIDQNIENEVFIFDDSRIASIVLNLVMNAIKFSPVGSQIKISVDFDSAKSWLNLSVADTGIGMSDEVKSYLFTMFKSITKKINDLDDTKGTSNTSGAGLGLTFCKTMIEQLGGEISFDSIQN